MNHTTTPVPPSVDITRHRRRIAELGQGIRDLKEVLSRMREEDQELYGARPGVAPAEDEPQVDDSVARAVDILASAPAISRETQPLPLAEQLEIADDMALPAWLESADLLNGIDGVDAPAATRPAARETRPLAATEPIAIVDDGALDRPASNQAADTADIPQMAVVLPPETRSDDPPAQELLASHAAAARETPDAPSEARAGIAASGTTAQPGAPLAPALDRHRPAADVAADAHRILEQALSIPPERAATHTYTAAPIAAPQPKPGTTTAGQQQHRTALQRAIERLRGRTNTERASAAGGSRVGGPMELLAYWKIIWKRLWLLVLLMVIGSSSTAYYMYQQPPRYSSTTTLYLNPAAASALMSYSYDGLQAMARTYTEFMKTRSFAGQVSQELNAPLAEATIIGALSTTYVADTQFFRISATYTDPKVAQSLASTAAKVLIDQNIARQQAQQEQIQTQSKSDPERDRLVEVRATLQQELDLYNKQIENTQAKLNDLLGRPTSDENEKQILAVQTQLVNMQSARLSAINGLADTQAALTTSSNVTPNVDTAVVVDEAPLPLAPLPNQTIQYTLIALLASLTLGAAIAFLLEYVDYTIKDPETLERIYGSAPQGVIGMLAGKRLKGRSRAQLVTLIDPHSPIAESFRALRTGVGVAGLVSPLRSVLVTSAQPGEGKSFVAANLAISLAQNGHRVILVDADLRKPSLHYTFNLPLEPGFSNLVVGAQSAIDDVLQPTEVENLRVLTCGIVPPNPAELLGSPRAVLMMEQLARHADVVVYDSPPAATVIDAVVLGPRVDAVLHVIHAGKTRIDLVRRCRAMLERGGAHVLGAVLNQVRMPELQSYAYYYSYTYAENGKSHKNGKHHGKSVRRETALLAPANGAKPHTNGTTVVLNGSDDAVTQ
ncbi:MAG: polysaccharide biosynthesis tyrosine autokinase [Kouleothrix sp.]|nr:polysaccharide biosynthesis tyrosine autokinase [Kouleothrix sp.]